MFRMIVIQQGRFEGFKVLRWYNERAYRCVNAKNQIMCESMFVFVRGNEV